MRNIVLVSTWLACIGRGSQVQNPAQRLQQSSVAQQGKPVEVDFDSSLPQGAEVLQLSRQASVQGTPLDHLKVLLMLFLAFNSAFRQKQVAFAFSTCGPKSCSAASSRIFGSSHAVASNGPYAPGCQSMASKWARSPRCAQMDGSVPSEQVFTFPDGSTYCGEIANGRMCGQGEWRSTDGSSYIGSFLEDTFHGDGRYTDANGNCFVGSFQYGAMHGTGTYVFTNGRAEVGTYLNGADVEGVRWSPDRMQAWRLHNGKMVAEISLAEAAAFANSVSLPVPPSIVELGTSKSSKTEAQAQSKGADDCAKAPEEGENHFADVPAWQRNWLQLTDWIKMHGGIVDSVVYASAGDGVRGMYATRSIGEGEIVCRVPMACCYDYASSEQSPVSHLWRECEPNLPAWGRLALGLLYEKRLGKDSHKALYIATLPHVDWFREHGPLDMWEPEEVALCESLQFVAKQRQYDLASSALLSDASLRAHRWLHLKLPGEPPSNEEVIWAIACVTSRSLGDIGMYAQDLFNHKLPNNAELMHEPDGLAIVMKAIRPIEKGEQVYISYGMYPNLVLLSQYGFMQPANPIMLTLVACGEKLAPLLAKHLPAHAMMMSPDGSIAEWQAAGSELQAALNKLAAEGKLPDELLAKLQNESKGPTVLPHGVAVYALLLRQTLASFSCTAAEARLAMETEGLAIKSQLRMALMFSCEQQDMLNKELTRIESL